MSYPGFWLIIILGSYGTYGKGVDHVPFPTLDLCEATLKRIDELYYRREDALVCPGCSNPSSVNKGYDRSGSWLRCDAAPPWAGRAGSARH